MIVIMSIKKNKNSTMKRQHRRPWQTPPEDIMEFILQRLSFWDRIQFRMVCKSWRSVSMRKDIRSSPNEMPWLLLPPPESPSFTNNDSILFFSLSDTKVHKLTLPRAFGQGWVHGSSKNWLIMVKGAYSHMFLLNPISGALQKLPSFVSIFPYIGVLKELKGQLDDTQELDNFCNRVELSSSDIYSEQCMVAAIFRSRILAVCRPGEKRWRKVLTFEESADAPKLCDVLFSSGVLYALVNLRGDNNGLDVATQAKICRANKVEVKFVHDRVPPPIQTTLMWQCQSHLLESTTENEILLIQQIQSTDKGGIIRIVVYKLDIENNNFTEVKHLGNQVIFSSRFGSLSLASSAYEGNCVCFATSETAGVFYLSSGAIEQVGNSLVVSGKHGSCWLTPSL